MSRTGQGDMAEAAAPRNRLGYILIASAIGAWILALVSLYVTPAGYGILNSPAPPEPLGAMRFYIARGLFHFAHTLPLLVILSAVYSLCSRRSRSLWLHVASIVVSASFVTTGVAWGTYPNIGLPIGYYGKMNQVVAELKRIPNVEIVDVGIHRDITLEDFWITIMTDEAEEELAFVGASVRSVDDLCTEFKHLSDAT